MNKGGHVNLHPPVPPRHIHPVVIRSPPVHLAVAIVLPEVELAERHVEREPLDVVLALSVGQRGLEVGDLRSRLRVEDVVGDKLRARAHLLEDLDSLREAML